MISRYISRRSNIMGTGACVGCQNSIAAKTGIDVLEKGGNAADAAVAMAATLTVVEPMLSGLGGDAFCLFYEKSSKSVKGLNGSGRSGSGVTLDYVSSLGFSEENPVPSTHGLTVNVPGAPAAMIDTIQHFGSGKFTLEELLLPAIDYAQNGFPVLEATGYSWNVQEDKLTNSRFGRELLKDGRAPRIGEIMKLPTMADTLRALAQGGRAGFYEGKVAEAIAEEVTFAGGKLSTEDLKAHESTLIQPISTSYKGIRVWEMPPSQQAINALTTLNILEGFDLKGLGNNSAKYLHLLIEALKLSFADILTYVADPTCDRIPTETLLDKNYATHRRNLISTDRALEVYFPGDIPGNSDTTYVSVVDPEGNACSYIASNYEAFGSGIVPRGCGISLHNRGLNFNLRPEHPNVIAPRKRPFHTIIPALLTDDQTGDLLACYGIVGAFMQSQAHVQVLLNMCEFGMSPQEALDNPRLFINVPNNMGGRKPQIGPVLTEEGIPHHVVEDLRAKGHEITGNQIGLNRRPFGLGSVITRGAWWLDPSNPLHVTSDPAVLWAGADPRGDGCAFAL